MPQGEILVAFKYKIFCIFLVLTLDMSNDYTTSFYSIFIMLLITAIQVIYCIMDTTKNRVGRYPHPKTMAWSKYTGPLSPSRSLRVQADGENSICDVSRIAV